MYFGRIEILYPAVYFILRLPRSNHISPFGTPDRTEQRLESPEKSNQMKSNVLNLQIWSMSATTLNTARPDWFPGQVTVNSQSDFRLVLEGKATNGGFAVDQLVFNAGKCESKLVE